MVYFKCVKATTTWLLMLTDNTDRFPNWLAPPVLCWAAGLPPLALSPEAPACSFLATGAPSPPVHTQGCHRRGLSHCPEVSWKASVPGTGQNSPREHEAWKLARAAGD